MKSIFRRSIAALATVATAAVGFGTVVSGSSVAASFGQKEVDQTKFAAIASPVNSGSSHQLLVLEQISSTKKCWGESGNAPTIVDPLLLSFDFTGICGRSTDSNGYSIRANGQDLGLQYSLRVQQRNGDMVLVGVPFGGRGQTLEIARANGATNNFAKLNLKDGWRFTKRTYEGQTLGHVYLTYDGDLAATAISGSTGGTTGGNTGGSTGGTTGGSTGGNTGGGSVVVNPTPVSFADIRGDLYQSEIEEAVAMGFVAGFSEDNTFRPRATLTREQVVSMALESLENIPNVSLTVPTSVSRAPFRDVATSRWSAAKIQFAQQEGIVAGYGDGNFRPTQAVTRAELMSIMRRTAEYAQELQGKPTTLVSTQAATNFSDVAGHWSQTTVNEMSSYCGVASPMNESGNRFSPNSSALRNYAAAATLRMIECATGEEADS
jgi:hypothetical protein